MSVLYGRNMPYLLEWWYQPKPFPYPQKPLPSPDFSKFRLRQWLVPTQLAMGWFEGMVSTSCPHWFEEKQWFWLRRHWYMSTTDKTIASYHFSKNLKFWKYFENFDNWFWNIKITNLTLRNIMPPVNWRHGIFNGRVVFCWYHHSTLWQYSFLSCLQCLQ